MRGLPRLPTRRSLALLALLLLQACAPAPPPITSLERGVAPLRAAFNADGGRTRVVMLVAPT